MHKNGFEGWILCAPDVANRTVLYRGDTEGNFVRVDGTKVPVELTVGKFTKINSEFMDSVFDVTVQRYFGTHGEALRYLLTESGLMNFSR